MTLPYISCPSAISLISPEALRLPRPVIFVSQSVLGFLADRLSRSALRASSPGSPSSEASIVTEPSKNWSLGAVNSHREVRRPRHTYSGGVLSSVLRCENGDQEELEEIFSVFLTCIGVTIMNTFLIPQCGALTDRPWPLTII